MPVIKEITIEPNLPEKLRPLLDIAYNLWWTWTPDAIYLFEDMDRECWEKCNHNPVSLLGTIEQPRLEELANDEVFLARMDAVRTELNRYLSAKTWYDKAKRDKGLIAYFSAEFGLHESLPLYSGGLGILAGDHMKSASDLGLPLAGVGLLYKHGYLTQYLNPDGWQLEKYPTNDFYKMPLRPVKAPQDGGPLLVEVPMDDRNVLAKVWQLTVGRVNIYLLDTDIPENRPGDRQITSHLYGGDIETRLIQEIVLGMGGIRALKAMGKLPTVCHMNEGHSAFMAIERLLEVRLEENLAFDEALEAVRATNIFTTHTPVPAGIDRFPPELIQRYFQRIADSLGISMHQFLGLGRINPNDSGEPFCMAVLAIKMASQTNGVSKLHGEVSRRMWSAIWPNIPTHEVPITHITNGIHTLGWLSSEMARLYQRYLGSRWIDEPTNHSIWKRVSGIPNFEIWRSKERLRDRLISFARHRLKKQLEEKGAPRYKLKEADEVLDPEALTIGFARRFATYKRATLLFHDVDRLRRILTNEERPVQIIFAGKAHPKDKEGKELIHKIVQMANLPEFRKHIVFIENYDIEVARFLVQGVDVWLNTPRRPLEASGTSGMKVTANGGINLSILDGWWVEAYNGNNGWAIGAGEEYDDPIYQDEVESRLLYELLENTVIPLFYQRNTQNVPDEWVEMIKNSIQSICPFFNTNRMVEEYSNQFYLPGLSRWALLTKEGWKETKEICSWKRKVLDTWSKVRIVNVELLSKGAPKVGDRIPIRAEVELAGLRPDEVRVEAYIGRFDEHGNISGGSPLPLLPSNESKGTIHVFTGKILCLSSGRIGFTVRCYPYRKELGHQFELGQLTWWE